MPQIARIVGGAGTGKTTSLIGTMQQVLESGVSDPLSIGFVSFTRAARREASERAADRFGGRVDQLEGEGWFRTLHGVCFRLLGMSKGQVIADDKKWIGNAVQEAVDVAIYDGIADVAFDTSTDAGKALGMWDYARNRLIPYAEAHERAWRINESTPSLEYCERVVELYEQAKRLDDRCDFVDMLGRFAGVRFHLSGPSHVSPEGAPPNIPVWFFDEQQDTSPLLDAVCHRLIESSKWVYVVGDPFQAIYGWAGAMGRLFMQWPAEKTKTLPKSYRCPPPIHHLGEAILRRCSDYWDRGISAADHDGRIEQHRWHGGLTSQVRPDESWLLVARTNYHAARLSRELKKRGIPWVPTKGNGGWNAPARNEILRTIWALQNGLVIRGSQWRKAVKAFPADLLERGTKTRMAEMSDGAADKEYPRLFLESCPGGTPQLDEIIRSGRWQTIVEHGAEWVAAVERWGESSVMSPKIKVGTIHSVKGAEADNVIWLTTLTNMVRRGWEDPDVRDEERRLAYVAVTRARRRLIVAVEPNAYRFEVPL